LELNFYEPVELLKSHYVIGSKLKRIAEIEKKHIKILRPGTSIPEPAGLACSFCRRTEAEVSKMAKHESGVNICSMCIELCAEVLRE